MTAASRTTILDAGPGSGLLERETLYGVISVIASSPDLDRVLSGVVDVLTRATRCHACFVYLRRADRLRLRAASTRYAQAVGQVEFGLDEGLAGWVATRNRLAFIPDNALDDPRTVYVPQLEEERFQSIVAVPISSRSGTIMGVIVLHTVAPREFDEGTLNLLTHAAPLVAGVIENAQLYEDARRRVATLSALSTLSQRIASVASREELYGEATSGLRAVLGTTEVRLYVLDPELRRLELVAADPPIADGTSIQAADANPVLLDLLQHRGRRDHVAMRRVRAALTIDSAAVDVRAVTLSAGGEHLGVLVSASTHVVPDDSEEILRAIADQAAVALKKTELIERLTEENIVHTLFAALERGDVQDAELAAYGARYDLRRSNVLCHVQRPAVGDATTVWAHVADRLERGLRRQIPGTLCDIGSDRIRALIPLPSGSEPDLVVLDAALHRLACTEGVSIGRSEVHAGPESAPSSLREAADAARVSAALTPSGGALAYSELGAFRYLVHLIDLDATDDAHLTAVGVLADYDRRRGSQLVTTLAQYLADRRSVTETARTLMVHPNTLRQRLDRIETLTGLKLVEEDLLALELATKIARLRAPVAG